MASVPKQLESDVLPDPDGLKVSLMPHQKQALRWLIGRENAEPSGGIFADDRELEKELTMISLILTQKQKASVDSEASEPSKSSEDTKYEIQSSATLIVTTKAFLKTWENSIKDSCEDNILRIYTYHGLSRLQDADRLSSYDVILTTYGIIRSELGRKEDTKKKQLKLTEDEEEDVSQRPVLLRINWNRIILDEAHYIRNPQTLISTAVCRLHAKTRWALTEILIQNKLDDIFSLIRFLGFSYEDFKSQIGKDNPAGNNILNTFMLRRTKTYTVDGNSLDNLPKKKVIDIKLTLSEVEMNLYTRIKEADMEPQGLSPSAKRLLRNLHLRQCCCHLSLLEEEEYDLTGLDTGYEDQVNDLPSIKNDDVNEVAAANEIDIYDPSKESTKIIALMKEIKKVRKKDRKAKCIVVSEWTEMLRLIAPHLKAAGWRYHLLESDVSLQKRDEIVKTFNENPDGPAVMLLSLKLIIPGFNLTGGSHLFFVNIHWNPVLENQICSYVHRSGQKKDVVIYRFICENTIEEEILDLQKQKRELAQSVLVGDLKDVDSELCQLFSNLKIEK